MALEVVLNGQARVFEQLDPGCGLHELVAALGVKSDRVAMELNGEIAARATWHGIFLKSGDKLEMVHFVGGG